MPNPPGGWPRVERLDAERMAAAVRSAAGVALRVDGACPGGQVGAAYVTWPDGHRSVLKWRPAVRLEDLRAGPLAVAAAARAAGYPAPAVELAVQAGEAVVSVWELLPGAPPGAFTGSLLDQALDLNDRQAGLLAGHPGVPPVDLYLTRDGPGFCLHEPLHAHSDRTRSLLTWITEVGARSPRCLAGDDAVHCDFQPTNILADDDHITGIVDWDGAARGNRRLDLVTLRFGLHGLGPHGLGPHDSGPHGSGPHGLGPHGSGPHGIGPHGIGPRDVPADDGVVSRLDRMLDALPADELAPLWAHMSLRMIDWAIRHFTPADVTHWLNLAEQRTR